MKKKMPVDQTHGSHSQHLPYGLGANRWLLLWLMSTLFCSCAQREKPTRPQAANLSCKGFFVQGQFEYDTYTFCSTVPREVQYGFETGDWKFWNKQGQLLAEGVFQLEKKTIKGHGGCAYECIEGEIAKDAWQVWDENGNPIQATDQLLKQLKDCVRALAS